MAYEINFSMNIIRSEKKSLRIFKASNCVKQYWYCLSAKNLKYKKKKLKALNRMRTNKTVSYVLVFDGPFQKRLFCLS